MSDDQAEQLEQPALIGVAEALVEHAANTVRLTFNRWYGNLEDDYLEGYTRQGQILQGWNAGWRAALEWYIGLGLERNLLDAIQEAYVQGQADATRDGPQR